MGRSSLEVEPWRVGPICLCIKSGGNSRQGAQHKQSWGKGINEYLFIVSSRDSREGLCAHREDED